MRLALMCTYRDVPASCTTGHIFLSQNARLVHDFINCQASGSHVNLTSISRLAQFISVVILIGSVLFPTLPIASISLKWHPSEECVDPHLEQVHMVRLVRSFLTFHTCCLPAFDFLNYFEFCLVTSDSCASSYPYLKVRHISGNGHHTQGGPMSSRVIHCNAQRVNKIWRQTPR